MDVQGVHGVDQNADVVRQHLAQRLSSFAGCLFPPFGGELLGAGLAALLAAEFRKLRQLL